MVRMLLSFISMACSFVAHLIFTCLKVAYTVLKILHIRLLALYLCVCGILQLAFSLFTGENAVYFWLGVACCLFATVVSWSITLRKKRAARRRAQEEKRLKREEALAQKEEKRHKKAERRKHDTAKGEGTQKVYPVYFEAEGHPGYVFAEYEDRYDLFRRSEDGKLVFVRTDPKTDANQEEQT